MAVGQPPRSKRLRFREMANGDLEALYRTFADADARRIYPQMEKPEEVQAWIDWNRQNYDRYGFGLWLLTSAETGDAIGDCGLTYQKVEDSDELEIGYHIARQYRRRGYALEAGRAVLEFAFRHTDAALVCSKVAPENAGSIAVASRLHVRRRTYRDDAGREKYLFYTLRGDGSW